MVVGTLRADNPPSPPLASGGLSSPTPLPPSSPPLSSGAKWVGPDPACMYAAQDQRHSKQGMEPGAATGTYVEDEPDPLPPTSDDVLPSPPDLPSPPPLRRVEKWIVCDFKCNHFHKTLLSFKTKMGSGQDEGDDGYRSDALQLATELGADYVDVELKFIVSMHDKNIKKCKIIISSHNYENTPSVEELGNLVAKIQAAGVDIVKIATTALNITDVARMLHITAHSQLILPVGLYFFPSVSLLCFRSISNGIVMGNSGLMSRVISAKFGSKSPILYYEAFKSVNFNGVYTHLLVVDISSFFRAYSSKDFDGFMFVLFYDTQKIQSCVLDIERTNFDIRRESDGKLFGYYTDYNVGAITRCPEDVTASANSPLKGKPIIVIGIGGTGRD
ncbi:hypothetical protein MLD38_040668 [Melastoma candidum]|nr:hypothetical protein MLD38_040668 [Melastoma candidum]